MQTPHHYFHGSTKASAATRPLVGGGVSTRVQLSGLWELTKPRLSFLSLLTAVVGYLAAKPGQDLMVLAWLIAGTSLAAGGAAALNQWWEHYEDARMVRTRGRPIPSGTISPPAALAFGLTLALTGCAILLIGTHPLAALLACATISTYVLVYTPLKKISVGNTLVGAIPGALPPLIGWSAATGSIAPMGWILFGILFTWQIPHFYAIAWIHRADYSRAGYRMLPAIDPTGRRVSAEAFVFTVLLVACSLLPVLLGESTLLFGMVAAGSGAYFLRLSWRFFRDSGSRQAAARGLFLGSLFYLPLLLTALLVDVLWIR